MNPEQPHGPPMTLGNVREQGLQNLDLRLAMGARVTNGLTPEQQKERLEIVRGEAERAHNRNDRFFKQANKSAIDLATLTVRRTGKSNRRNGETQADIARTYGVDATTIGRLDCSGPGETVPQWT